MIAEAGLAALWLAAAMALLQLVGGLTLLRGGGEVGFDQPVGFFARPHHAFADQGDARGGQGLGHIRGHNGRCHAQSLQMDTVLRHQRQCIFDH